MGHGHHHDHSNQSGKNLRTAFFLNLFFTIFELIGGVYVNSVAIISDAIHDLGDSLSLGTAWYLDSKSKKAADSKYSFGYARFSLLAALINSVVLIAGSIYVVSEAIKRFIEPEFSKPEGMIFFAIVGISVNAYAAWKMNGGRSLNEKVVTWHLVEDVLGWVAILIVSIVLLFYQNPYLDPTLSLIITLWILWNVIKRLKETLYLFLQGVPKELDLLEIEKSIEKIAGVHSVHDTRIWSLEGEHHVFSTHVRLSNMNSLHNIIETKRRIKQKLEKYHFKHVTIETELEDEEEC